MRVPLEWLREFVEVDEPAAVLAERLPTIGLGVEAVEQVGEDTVLDLEVTPNRPDCLGLLGVAREVAILFGRPLRLPPEYEATFGVLRRPVRGVARPRSADDPAGPHSPPARLETRAAGPGREARTVFPAAWRVAIEIEDPQGCPRFTASVIEDARVGPSPGWMQTRLEAAGIRAINNIVDVTNYVMLEYGQPMHAFDYSKITGRRLVVRRARRGETLETLDGVTRPLEDTMLVVSDGQRAVSLAGIIGGRATEIIPGTTSLLLEAAYWDPVTIARNARRLGIRTEASARFERGTDPEGPPRAQARAVRLLVEVSGGHVVSSLADVYPTPIIPRVIHLRPERAVAVLGVEISREDMARSLRSLGCEVSGTRTLTVRVPTFRPDLVLEEDLIEEIVRLHGYDRVPLTLPRGETTPGVLAPVVQADRQVRDILTRCGLTEVSTLTLVPPDEAGSGGGMPVRLENPLVADQAALRTSLLPGLFAVLVTNASRRIGDVQIFELGRTFRSRGAGDRPEERRTIGIAVTGRWRFGWNAPEEQAVADLFHLRWILDALFGELGVPSWRVSAATDTNHSWWHPGRMAEVGSGDRIVARFGELHPDLSAPHRFPHRAYLAEVDLEGLLVFGQSLPELVPLAPRAEGKSKLQFERSPQSPVRPLVPVKRYAGLPRYPEVERDLAVVVPSDRPAAQIEAIIRDAAASLLETLELFDVYTGPPVPSGHRNLAYRLRLRAPDRTLTAAEAEEIMERVRIALRTRAGAQIRA